MTAKTRRLNLNLMFELILGVDLNSELVFDKCAIIDWMYIRITILYIILDR